MSSTIATKLQDIKTSKADAKAAINYKGVTCDDEFDQYGNRIRQIRVPQTTTLLRPAVISGWNNERGSGEGYATYNTSANSVKGNDVLPLGIYTTKHDTIEVGIYYDGNNSSVIKTIPLDVDSSYKRDVFIRCPFAGLIIVMGHNITQQYEYQKDWHVDFYGFRTSEQTTGVKITENTVAEVYFVGIKFHMEQPHYYMVDIDNVYLRLTNEDII